MKSLQKSILIMAFFVSGCTFAGTKKDESVKEGSDLKNNQQVGEREPFEFLFGELSLYIPDNRGKESVSCGDKITEYVEKEYRCQEFQVGGKTFFEGVYRKVKGELAEGGIFEDTTEPKLILDTRYFKRIKLSGNTYILAIEYDFHDTLSVLYQLSVVNDKVSLNRIATSEGVFTGIHSVPGGVVISGYDYGPWIPWAIFLSGNRVQELEFLGEPAEFKVVDEVIVERDDEGNMFIDGVSVEEIRKTFPANKNSPKNSDDKQEETKEKVRY